MAYLIAAILMTLSVLEGQSLLQTFQVRFLVFVVRRAVPLHLQSFLLTTTIVVRVEQPVWCAFVCVSEQKIT